MGSAGDVLKVPLKQVHTATTAEEGALPLRSTDWPGTVFRASVGDRASAPRQTRSTPNTPAASTIPEWAFRISGIPVHHSRNGCSGASDSVLTIGRRTQRRTAHRIRASGAGRASHVARTLSIRWPSISTTSNRQPFHSKCWPVEGITPRWFMTNPARV